jgi:uncharacterized RDD family membrane protein YckC
VSRGIAAVIDGVVACLMLLLAYGAIAVAEFVLRPRDFQLPQFGLVFSLVSLLVVLVVYLALSWWVSGRSYGAVVMGLRVVARGGGGLGLGRAAARAVVCALVPVGLLWVAFSPRNRSLQDQLFGTSVVYDWRQ